MATFTGTTNADTFNGTIYADIFEDISVGDAVRGGSGQDVISVALSSVTSDVHYNAIRAASRTGDTPLTGMSIKGVELLAQLWTGSGNDSLTIGLSNLDVSQVGRTIWHAGAGTDRLIMDLSASAGGANFAYNGPVAAIYAVEGELQVFDIEAIELKGTNYDDSFVYALSNSVLNGNGGDDYFTIDLTTGVTATVFNGGSGNDGADVDLSGTTLDVDFDALAAATSSGISLAGNTLRNIERFGVVSTGSGDDTFTVEDSTLETYFYGQTTWNAGEGDDRLVADMSESASRIYFSHWEDRAQLQTYRGDFISYGIEHVDLTGTQFDDYISVDLTDSTYRGAGGDDVFRLTVGPSGSSALIDGGEGDDIISIDLSSRNEAFVFDGRNFGNEDSDIAGATLRDIEFIDTIYTAGGDDVLDLGEFRTNGGTTWYAGSGNDRLVLDYSQSLFSISSFAYTDSVFHILTPTGLFEALDVESLELTGTDYEDSLFGMVGIDVLRGGKGDDIYFVNNTEDRVIEDRDGGEFDIVYSSVAFDLSGTYVEMMFLSGTDNINAHGNQLDNVLVGNDGGNRLNGRGGADTMLGGLGNDIYYVDDAGDVVIEDKYEGRDLVYSTISYTLTRAVENLTLRGTAAINGTGNGLHNKLTGNDAVNVLSGMNGNDTIRAGGGDDAIIGGRGHDWLYGEGGADDFIFETASLNDLDHIYDFVSGVDRLLFNAADYATSAVLTLGSESVGAGAQFVYDAATHTLSYDADGDGAGAMIGIAIFENAAALVADDFVFV